MLDRHGIEQVDLIVLDVEGHELSVLRGMEGTPRWPRVSASSTATSARRTCARSSSPSATCSTASRTRPPTSRCPASIPGT